MTRAAAAVLADALRLSDEARAELLASLDGPEETRSRPGTLRSDIASKPSRPAECRSNRGTWSGSASAGTCSDGEARLHRGPGLA